MDARCMEAKINVMVSHALMTAIVTAGAADTSFRSPSVDAYP